VGNTVGSLINGNKQKIIKIEGETKHMDNQRLTNEQKAIIFGSLRRREMQPCKEEETVIV
jgi:hypothetical protein